MQLLLDARDGLQERRARRDVVRIGVDLDEFQLVGLVPGQRIELLDQFDFVAEQVDPPGPILVVRREDVDGVAAHPKRTARKIRERALVLQRHEIGDQPSLVDALALLDGEGHGRIGLHRADAVDARHRGNDDHVVAFEQRARRRMAHAVDLLVDGGFLLDIGVGTRHIGLGLVVVVIRHEIFDRIVREEASELAIELRRQRFVGGEDQGRPLGRLDHLGHRKGLAGAGDAEQHLGAVVAYEALDQFDDRLGLVALGGEIGFDDEALAALGFLRPWWTMRHPGLLAELGTALAQQGFQRLGGGGDPQGVALAGQRQYARERECAPQRRAVVRLGVGGR